MSPIHNIGVFLLAIGLTLSLSAQTTEDEASVDSSMWSIDLPDIVLTAQYKPTHYTKALHRVEVIKSKQLEDRGITQLDEALRTLSSVRVSSDPLLGTEVNMRTIGGNNIAILVDGVPLTGRLDGRIDISQIPIQNIQRIEIIQGPLSILYGNNAAGGVINIITKKFQRKKVEVITDAQIESLGILQTQARLGVSRKGFHAAVFGRYYSYDDLPTDSLRVFDQIDLGNGSFVSQNRYPWNPKEQYSYGASVAYQANDENYFSIQYDHNKEDLHDFGIVRRPRFNPYSDDEDFETTRNRVVFSYDRKTRSEKYVDFQASFNDFRRERKFKRYFHETDETVDNFSPTETTEFWQVFSRTTLTQNLKPNIKLMSGLTGSHEATFGDKILDPSREDSTTATISELALFTDVRYQHKELEISLAGRYTIHSNNTNRLTPSLMMKYRLSPKWQLRASYAQGYRTPSLKELYLEFIDINHFVVGNKDLVPEISNDFQFTGSYSNKDKTIIGINLYHTRIKDQIILVEFDNLKFNYQNIDQYNVSGLQLNLTHKISNLCLNHSSNLSLWNVDLPGDGAVDLNSSFDLNQGISYDIKSIGLRLNANYRFTASQVNYLFEDEEIITSTLAPIHLADITMNKNFWKNRIQLGAGVKNIANQQQANIQNQSATGNHVMGTSRLISQGRSVYLKLITRF